MKKLLTFFLLFILFSSLFTHFAKADQTVSATIPPRISDFQFNLDSSDSQPGQNEDITYQITYGAEPSAGIPTTLTIVADWGSAVSPDNSQVLDYVIGSASNGYGDAVPVVDLQNRTITWTISHLPAGTIGQTLTFTLKTITSYTAATPFAFSVHAFMNNEYVTLPIQTLTQAYHYKDATASFPPTPKPTAALTPTPTLTPIHHFAFRNVRFTGISDSKATIQTSTDNPAKITIAYGTSSTALLKHVSSDEYTLRHTLELNGLTADTSYYFIVTATDASGAKLSSDIITLHTAKPSPQPNVADNIIVLSADGTLLTSNSQKASDAKNPSILLTSNTSYTIAYNLVHPLPLKSIEVVVINKVLGASTFAASGPTEFIFPMEQRSPTLYVANLGTVPQGAYEVDVRLVDTNGNILEKKISDLKIMPKLTVYGTDTHTPLSDARMYLSYYDKQTNSYQPVTTALFGNIKNPSYTDTFGQSPITLPAGKYRIETSSLFYDPQVQDFTIGPGIDQNFPIIYLKRDPLNLISLLTYTKSFLSDSLTKILAIIVETASSIRIFHLVALEILVTFVSLTFFLFLFRSHLHVRHLPVFFLFHLQELFGKQREKYIFGKIVDEENNPLTRVLIEIEDAATKNILTQISSHKTGNFSVMNSFPHPISLLLIKEGYEPTHITIDDHTAIPPTGLKITMIKGTPHHETVISAIMLGLEEGFGMLFEAYLISSLILEILFTIFLRTQITLPFFFFLSLLNIILWMFYLKEKEQ